MPHDVRASRAAARGSEPSERMKPRVDLSHIRLDSILGLTRLAPRPVIWPREFSCRGAHELSGVIQGDIRFT